MEAWRDGGAKIIQQGASYDAISNTDQWFAFPVTGGRSERYILASG